MGEYKDTKTLFILTSRPKGYSDHYYTASKSALPIFINPFTPAQQADFIRRWYINQEVRVRELDRMDTALDVAKQRAADLIHQLGNPATASPPNRRTPIGLGLFGANPTVVAYVGDPASVLSEPRVATSTVGLISPHRAIATG